MSQYNKFTVIDTRDQFKRRALTALGIAIGADILDYVAAPVFAVPLIGDAFDAITIAVLYNVTKSKFSSALNMLEFIPVIGDLLPVYTFSTLAWIIKEVAEIYFKEPIKRKGSNVVSKPLHFFDKFLVK
ncbi:MAG: hypothetical protein ABJB85_04760, partial [Nitrososphaerota archaeon]